MRIQGTLGDIDSLNMAPFREPEVRLRRVPFKGSPEYYTPLRTIIKILFLIFSWALYEQK